jgi:hypothetical protein
MQVALRRNLLVSLQTQGAKPGVVSHWRTLSLHANFLSEGSSFSLGAEVSLVAVFAVSDMLTSLAHLTR